MSSCPLQFLTRLPPHLARISHTTTLLTLLRALPFAALAANAAIAAKKEAAPPPTAEQLRAIERLQELLKQERLKKTGGWP